MSLDYLDDDISDIYFAGLFQSKQKYIVRKLLATNSRVTIYLIRSHRTTQYPKCSQPFLHFECSIVKPSTKIPMS